MKEIARVKYVVQNGATVNAEASDGSTPLHWAVLNMDEPVVAKLIAAGADADAKTAVWTAVTENNARTPNFLLMIRL